MLVAQAKKACELFLGEIIDDSEIDRIVSLIENETMNIILIGMPGCGKSTVASLISEMTGRELIDTDSLIIETEGRSIPDIFARNGEDFFRVCEHRAAEAAGKPEAAAISVEAAYESGNNDPALLERVATYYTLAKRFDKARDVYHKLAALKPGDQRILQLLKNTEAQATMSAGWNDAVGKKGGFQQLIANKEQAKKLDQANKAMVVGDDADALIAEKLAQIEKEPGNLNFYRALARIYVQNKRFPEAIEILEKAVALNNSDPELDRMLSSTRTADYEYRIEQLKAAGKEDEAAELEGEKNQFVFDDLAARVERYPNDLHLHFELGLQYFTYEYYDEAVQHLQLAQKSPKDRLESLYYLAMCFVKKGQNDMGVMQLETARDQIPTMDELKKKIVYQLGLCAEDAGDYEKAYAYYKDVYSTDVTFADLNTRMLDVAAKLKK
jgi:tetratricopeptide (TPR) repeat protein